jgi:predicted lysophospholipase L1 biosynthesis ABC-type transport system permease subunit
MGPETGGEEMEVHRNMVAPRYFETMGIPLLAGREFTQADREKAPSVAIISQSLARVLGGATIGQRISVLGREADTEIVGIVGNARFTSVRATTPPTLYLPWSAAYRRGAGPQMTFAVRTVGHPASLMPDIRRALEDVDPLTPAFNLTTQVEQNARSWRRERVFTGVIVGAAVLTVLLACLGIWGTLSYSVARRTPEIGVRMALGAHRGDVVGLVARESFVSVLAGTLVGLTGAVVATHLIEAFLFGVGRLDPVAFGSAVATVFAGAAAATWLPARRAAAVDPVVALRQE